LATSRHATLETLF